MVRLFEFSAVPAVLVFRWVWVSLEGSVPVPVSLECDSVQVFLRCDLWLACGFKVLCTPRRRGFDAGAAVMQDSSSAGR